MAELVDSVELGVEGAQASAPAACRGSVHLFRIHWSFGLLLSDAVTSGSVFNTVRIVSPRHK